MNDDQARGFVVRYRGIWRGGPSNEELARLFAACDAAQIDAALDRLAGVTEHPPSVAALRREYNAASPQRYGWERPEDTGEVISPAQAYACNPELAAWRERRAHLRR